MNPRTKGDLAEVLVLAKLLSQDRRVAIPYGNTEGFDLLVESRDQKKWLKIQVKCAYRRGARADRIYIDTIRGTSLSKKRGYEIGAYDYLVGVLVDERLFWVLDFGEMYKRRCTTMLEDRSPDWERIP